MNAVTFTENLLKVRTEEFKQVKMGLRDLCVTSFINVPFPLNIFKMCQFFKTIFLTWTLQTNFFLTIWNPDYSEGSNTKQVWYSDGPKSFGLGPTIKNQNIQNGRFCLGHFIFIIFSLFNDPG